MATRGENRLHLYKRKAPEQEARRKKLADERREQRATARGQAISAYRGIAEQEPPVSSRQQKLEEWKKKRQVAPKPTRNRNENKPAFVFKKVTYNDTHLYKPLESSTFRPPKGVMPVQSSQSDRQLRSYSRNHHKGPPPTVREALSAFASALSKSKPGKTPKAVKQQLPSAKPKIDLNRTFDGPESPKQGAVPTEKIVSFNVENCGKIETVPIIHEYQCQTSSQKLQNTSEEIKENVAVENERKRVKTKKTTKNSSVQEAFQDRPPSRLPDATETSLSSTGPVEQPAEQKSPDYFRSLYSDAVEKLNSLCSKWTTQQSPDLPESVNDDIDVAVGYARLLITQKLQQFLELIVEHEDTNSTSNMKVLSTDLDGFWGIVNNQLQDIYRKFDKLETLSFNNWQDSTTSFLPLKAPTQNNSKKPKIKPKGHASSALRSFLAQARKQAQADAGDSKMDGVLNSSLMQTRFSSPIVMRVTSRAKQLGSPRTPATVLTPRSPFRVMQSENVEVIAQTPKSAKRASARRQVLHSGSVSLRRSTRIMQKIDIENID